MIFTVIGTTYAVLLAFMATAAWEQASVARALVRHAADLIGSVWRVSFGVADPRRAVMRAGLTAHLTRVIKAGWPEQIAAHSVPAAQPPLADLDRIVLGMAPVGAG